MHKKLISFFILFFILTQLGTTSMIELGTTDDIIQENLDDIDSLRGYPSEEIVSTTQFAIQEDLWKQGESVNVSYAYADHYIIPESIVYSVTDTGNTITEGYLGSGGIGYLRTFKNDGDCWDLEETDADTDDFGDFSLQFQLNAKTSGTFYYDINLLTYFDNGTWQNTQSNDSSVSLSSSYIDADGKISFSYDVDYANFYKLKTFNHDTSSYTNILSTSQALVWGLRRMRFDHLAFTQDAIVSYPRAEYQTITQDIIEWKIDIQNHEYQSTITVELPADTDTSTVVINPSVTYSISSDTLTISDTIPTTYTITATKEYSKQYLAISQFKSYDFEGDGGDNLNSTIVSSGAFSERKTSGNLNFEDDDLPVGYYYIDVDVYIETAPDAVVLQYYDGSSWINATSASITTTNRWQQLFAYLHPTGVTSGYTIRIVIDGSGIVFYDDINFNTVNHEIETSGYRRIKVKGQLISWNGKDNPAVSSETLQLELRDRTADSSVVSASKTTDSNGNFEWEVDTSSYSQLQDQREILFHITNAQFDSNLIAYWDFDEGTGATAEDQTSNDHDATLSTAPDWVSGRFINALDFERSSSEYLTVGDHDDFSFTGDSPFSIVTWIKLESNNIWQNVISKYPSGEWLFQIDTSGKVRVGVWDSDSDSLYQQGSTTITTGQYYHIAMIYDGSESASGLQIVVNGEFESETDLSAGTYNGMSNTATAVYIGARNGADYLDGVIDDIRIYSKELTQTEIQNIMYLTSPKSYFTPLKATDFPYYYETSPNDNEWDFSEEADDGESEISLINVEHSNGYYYAETNASNCAVSFPCSVDASEYSTISIRMKNNFSSTSFSIYDANWNLIGSAFSVSTSYQVIEINASNDPHWTGTETNIYVQMFSHPRTIWIDQIQVIKRDTPILSVADSYGYMASSNNSFEYRVEIDDVVQGYHEDLVSFSTDQTVGSHTINATVWDDTSRSGLVFLPGSSVTSSYTVAAIAFSVEVGSYYLSDSYVNIYVTATKDCSYTIYENDSSSGSGNVDKDGTAISHSRTTTYGSFIELAYKFVNSTDTVWFNTSYSNSAYTQLIITISTPILVDGRISLAVTSNLGGAEIYINDDSKVGVEVNWESEGVFSWYSNTIGENNITIQARKDCNGDSDTSDTGETFSDTVAYHLYNNDLEVHYSYILPYASEGTSYVFSTNYRGSASAEFRAKTQDQLGWSGWLSEDTQNGTYDFTFVNCDLDTTYNFSVEIRVYVTDESPGYQYFYDRIEYTPYSPDAIISNPQGIHIPENTTLPVVDENYLEIGVQSKSEFLSIMIGFTLILVGSFAVILFGTIFYLTKRLPDEGVMETFTRIATEKTMETSDKITSDMMGILPGGKQ